MIAAPRAHRPSMLRKARPEFGTGARLQSMGSNSHDTQAAAHILAVLSRLPEKIDATPRPIHVPRTIREFTRTAKILLKAGKQSVELREMLLALVGIYIITPLLGCRILGRLALCRKGPTQVVRECANPTGHAVV